jgi:UMF1 family MFS transporter
VLKDKQVISWAMYDWANSVFATVVIAGFFPIIFKQYWAQDLTAEQSTFWLGSANSFASLIIVILAPLLGTVADIRGVRKRLLIVFMLIGVISTLLIYPVIAGQWWLVLIFYVLAIIGFMGANVFYDAMLIDVSRLYQIDKVSGLGFAMGYLGGGILLAACVYLSKNPQMFGFANTIDAILFAFIISAFWWLIFSMPLALWVEESSPIYQQQPKISVFKETVKTFRHILKDKNIKLFLIAYWLYIDGVDTIIRMAVDYGLALGFDSGDLIVALLITQFVGFPAAIIYSYIGNKVGVKAALLVGISIYGLITVFAFYMQTVAHFYLLAIIIGLVQGGVQALSRSFYARLIPQHRAAEYFGVYNMMGKAAAIIGPVLMGTVALMTDSHRYSMLSITLLFVGGLVVLLYVKEPANKGVS